MRDTPAETLASQVVDEAGELRAPLMAYLLQKPIRDYPDFMFQLGQYFGKNGWLLDYELGEEAYRPWFLQFKEKQAVYAARREDPAEASPPFEAPTGTIPAPTQTQRGVAGGIRRTLGLTGGVALLGGALFALSTTNQLGSEQTSPKAQPTAEPAPVLTPPEQVAPTETPDPVAWKKSALSLLRTDPDYDELPAQDRKWLEACGAEAVVLVQCKNQAVFVATPEPFSKAAKHFTDRTCAVDEADDEQYKLHDGKPFGACGGIALVDLENRYTHDWNWEGDYKDQVLHKDDPYYTFRRLESAANLVCTGKKSGVYMAPVVRATTALPEDCKGHDF